MGMRIRVDSTSSKFKRIGLGLFAAAAAPNLFLILLGWAGDDHLPMEPCVTFASSLLLWRCGSEKPLFFYNSCEFTIVVTDFEEWLLPSGDSFEASDEPLASYSSF